MGTSAGAANNSKSSKKLLNPVDDFVYMENDLAGDICASVDAALSALKKVSCAFYYILLPTLECFLLSPKPISATVAQKYASQFYYC